MAIAKMPSSVQSANTSSLNILSDDMSTQLQADFIQATPVEKPEVHNQTNDIETVARKESDIQTVEPVSKNNSDTVIARLSKGKRAEFKSFFAKYGVTMTGGIEMCVEYVIRQVELGNVKVSKAGINEKL